ncbi:hypothetical protein CSKR_111262, partial [Clonorchis sinensis]
LQTIEQGSKTLICISFTKLNIHLLLESVFLNFSGYSLTVIQIQANATKRLRQFSNRSHFSRGAKRIYEKTYSHASLGSKTLICISFTKLNIHLLLESVFLNFSGYSLTVIQIQANATKRLRQFSNRSHFSRGAKRIYEKTYSHASLVVSTLTLIGSKTLICISFTKLNIHLLLESVFLNFSGYSLTVIQIQANATKRLRQFSNRSHFSRGAKRIYEKTYSHASLVVSTVTLIVFRTSRFV